MNINISKYGRGFPLVFFHGWGFDSHIWLTLVPRLSVPYQLVLVDLPGFGHSSLMDWDLFKDKLLTQLPRQFAVLGWSMGGLYAMRLAIEEPEKVNYLMSISATPRFLADDLWPGVAKEVFTRFYQNLCLDSHASLKEFISLYGLEIIAKNFFLLPEQPVSPKALELGLDVIQTWDLREKLKGFSRPSCFIFGRLDSIVPAKTMYCMQQNYPNFKYLLFKRAAHIPFLSHIDLFIEAIQGFIK